MLKKSNILAVLTLAVLLCSCSKSKLNRDVVTAGEVDVNITVDWPESVEDRPEQMYVVANRLVGTTHFGYLYPDMTPIDPAAEAVPQPSVWPNGDYYVVCFSRDDDLYTPASLVEFTNDNNVSLKDISVSLPVLSDDEKAGLLEPGMRDFNPCAGFLRDAEQFYAALNILRISPEHSTEVVMTPKNLTQKIRIKFTVNLLDGVEIKSIRTFMSGAVGLVHPMTSIVNYRDLYKINMPVSELSSEGTSSAYLSEANVLGLFPSKSAEVMTGDGIFQVILSAGTPGGDKIFYAAINLKQTIEDAGIMALAEDQSGYVIARNEAYLHISDILTISKDGVIGSTDADGVEKWKVHEFIDVEL